MLYDEYIKALALYIINTEQVSGFDVVIDAVNEMKGV